jgi:SAM-dependent methyltransferase
MDVSLPLKKVRDMYAENIERSGPVSTAVGWNTPESQILRFRKLTEVIEPEGQPVSINDYGCGYGAHLDYLLENDYQISSYHGYDLSSEMLTSARTRHASFSGALDLREDTIITTEADYTFVSGTFYVRFDASEEEWEAYILQKLKEIDCYSIRGFSFNCLSTYVDWKQPHLYYGDPLFWFDYCKKNFSRKVSLLHDYPLYEWTILVRK